MCIMCILSDTLIIKTEMMKAHETLMLCKLAMQLPPDERREHAEQMAATMPEVARHLNITADDILIRMRLIARVEGPIGINRETGNISFVSLLGPRNDMIWETVTLSPIMRKKLKEAVNEGGKLFGLDVGSMAAQGAAADMRREDTPATDEKAAQQAGATVTNIMDRIINSTKH